MRGSVCMEGITSVISTGTMRTVMAIAERGQNANSHFRAAARLQKALPNSDLGYQHQHAKEV